MGLQMGQNQYAQGRPAQSSSGPVQIGTKTQPIVPLVAGAVVGGAMAAGGIAASIHANSINARGKPVYYGGGKDALAATREKYAGSIAEGAALSDQGVGGLAGYSVQGQNLADRGQALQGQGTDVLARQTGYMPTDTRGTDLLAQRQQAIGGLIDQQTKLALDASTQSNNALASSGNAGDRRAAMYANSQAGLQLGAQAQAMRAQAEQDMAMAQVGQYNQEGQFGLAGMGIQQSAAQSLAGLGSQHQLAGLGMYGQASGQLAGLGQQREGMYLDAQQNVEQAQLGADMDYEKRRQEEAQRRSDRWWGFGGQLIGGGANVMASGMGK